MSKRIAFDEALTKDEVVQALAEFALRKAGHDPKLLDRAMRNYYVHLFRSNPTPTELTRTEIEMARVFMTRED